MSASIQEHKDQEQEDPNDESAIDDSEDVDESEVVVAHRVREVKPGQLRINEILPFRFSPSFLPLTVSNLSSCVALENAAFSNPAQRMTVAKAEYRLSKCSNLCFGVFCSVIPSQAQDFPIETMAYAKPVETGRPDGSVFVLFAQLIATLGTNPVVHDEDMAVPPDWRAPTSPIGGPKIGHRADGRTICLHSFAVCPRLQGCGLGVLAMKSYLQIMFQAAVADRVALICEDPLVRYYKRFGFKRVGPSKAKFASGEWNDMVLEFAEAPAFMKKRA